MRTPVLQLDAMDFVTIPLGGKRGGPRVLITAGMDGDEYTGIAAAYRLRERLADRPLYGAVTVLPLVNQAGFFHGTAYSPVDGLYPKRVFPGNANGTDTERRMRVLYESYVAGSDLWIDLHGGSLTEDMQPFVWMYRSRRPALRSFQERFVRGLAAPSVVWDRRPFMTYSRFLDTEGIPYVLMECGGLGTSHKSDITRMTAWMEHAIGSVGILPGYREQTDRTPPIYTAVRYEVSPMDGFWQIGTASDNFLGQLFSPDMRRRRVIQRRNDFILWKKTGAGVRHGDILAAYAIP